MRSAQELSEDVERRIAGYFGMCRPLMLCGDPFGGYVELFTLHHAWAYLHQREADLLRSLRLVRQEQDCDERPFCFHRERLEPGARFRQVYLVYEIEQWHKISEALGIVIWSTAAQGSWDWEKGTEPDRTRRDQYEIVRPPTTRSEVTVNEQLANDYLVQRILAHYRADDPISALAVELDAHKLAEQPRRIVSNVPHLRQAIDTSTIHLLSDSTGDYECCMNYGQC